MAFDEHLANRIREALAHQADVEEKYMMGGLAFMVNGKMCVGIFRGEMMCRIDPSKEHIYLERQGCHSMDMAGKTMKGYLLVDETGTHSQHDLLEWINLCLAFNPHAKASIKKKRKT